MVITHYLISLITVVEETVLTLKKKKANKQKKTFSDFQKIVTETFHRKPSFPAAVRLLNGKLFGSSKKGLCL